MSTSMNYVIYFGFRAINYIHKTPGNEKKGLKLYEAKHVIDLQEKMFENETTVHAKVIRQTSVTLNPYEVVLQVSF